ncbi:MAG TPA: endonuclease III [Vicinamibacteria bacterium]|nr:endonuclease III [Vicinamibacteria bacterium]
MSGRKGKERWPEKKRRSRTIVRLLEKAYPGAQCALVHENPLQLLVATILSAQCTDARVNQVTPQLFARYPSARDLAEADPAGLEELIRSTGFFRNKAKSIRGAAQKITSDFDGEVPKTMEELVGLPGVARKTANVVLGTGFRVADGFVVDTHVFRLSHRLNLAEGKTPEQVEKELMELIPRKHWIDLGHILIHHGRRVCFARNPDCENCVVESLCPKLGVAPRKPKPAPRPRRPLRDRISSGKRSS